MTGKRWQGKRNAPMSLGTLVLASFLAGCTGTLGESDGSSGKGAVADGGDGPRGEGDGDGDTRPPPSCDTDKPYVGTSILRRMTRLQYDRTVLQLLGDDSEPARLFPVETREEGYDNQASSQHVQRPEVVAWETAASDLASRALSNFDRLLGCAESDDLDSCFSAQLPTLMRRVLREKPSTEETTRYQSFYDSLREEATPERSAELILRALLMAPQFLFIVEEGGVFEEGVSRLDGYEVASRLSFSLWNQAPDEALLDAAEAGLLDTKEGVAERARAMIEDERAANVVLDFHSQWIDLAELDNMVLPAGAPPELKESAKREIEWFINNWYQDGSGLIPDLFTSRASYVDSDLAALYGIDAPAEGPGATELPEGERAGLLTRAVFLGTHGIPPTRGDFVLARVLCSPVPPLTFMPPLPPDLGETATTRERFEKHAEDPCARACHGVLDPVGFAFENYDQAGMWRDTENGQPVDSATELTLSEESGVNGPISGALELSDKIASSPLATSCLSENWFRYSYGRVAKPVDDCSVASLSDALGDTGDVHDLLVALTQTDSFLYIRKEGL